MASNQGEGEEPVAATTAVPDRASPTTSSNTGLREGHEPQLGASKCCKILNGYKCPRILLSVGRIPGNPEGLELTIKCNLIA